MSNNRFGITHTTLSSLIVFIAITLLGSLSRLFIDTFASSCVLQLMVAIVLPAIYIRRFLTEVKHATTVERALHGFLIGFAGTTSFLAVGVIQYYFLGGRLQAYLALGRPLPPLTAEAVFGSLSLSGLLWLFWLIVSGIVSYISAKAPFRK